jgi:hypothetical protein
MVMESRMIRRVMWTLLCLLPFLLVGCTAAGAGTAESAKTFVGVRLHQSMLSTGQYVVDVAPNGDIAVAIQMGPGEMQRGSGHLTQDQIEALFKALQGWNKLEAEYPGDWQNLYEITYDDRTVTAHFLPRAPAQFITVKSLLDTYGRQIVEPASRPASRPASPGTATRP